MSHAVTCRKDMPGREDSKYKGQETYLSGGLKISKRPVWRQQSEPGME